MPLVFVKTLNDLLHDAQQLHIPPRAAGLNTYLETYPHLLQFFQGGIPDQAAMLQGALMVYGWMPTTLEIQLPAIQLQTALETIQAFPIEIAELPAVLDHNRLTPIRNLMHGSYIGMSKLLHFIQPENFPIWDSRVASYLTGRPNYRQRERQENPLYYHDVKNGENYFQYVQWCANLITQVIDGPIPGWVGQRLNEAGYFHQITPIRALELVMFYGGAAI